MNDAYDDDAVGWDSLVGYPDPNVTIPVSYEAFVEEWNSEMVYVFDRQGDVATITQTCSVVKNLVEYDVVVGDRLVVEPKLGRGIDRYRSYRLLYDSVGRRRSGFHGSGAAFPKGGPAAVSVGLCIVPPSVPVCRSRDSGSVPGRLRITSAPAPCRARRGIRWLSRSAGSRKSRYAPRAARDAAPSAPGGGAGR